MSLPSDVAAIKADADQSLVQIKAANVTLTAAAASLAAIATTESVVSADLKAAAADIKDSAASLRKIVDCLCGNPVVGIKIEPGPPSPK